MRAVFHRKLSHQLRSLFAVGFLLLSLLGTHWLGFSHGIAHTGLAASSQSLGSANLSCDENATITHSSASCHLFDALTLASFVSPDNPILSKQFVYTELTSALVETTVHQATVTPYQSQAPPHFIL